MNSRGWEEALEWERVLVYGAVAYLETADVRIREEEEAKENEVSSTTGVEDVAKVCDLFSYGSGRGFQRDDIDKIRLR